MMIGMKTPKALAKVIENLEKLPGIGPKTATRLGYYLLHVPQEQLDSFAVSLSELKLKTVRCSVCFNVGESDPCIICTDDSRDMKVICVVEQPLDVVAIESSNSFRGRYHVLHGAIDPLNYIGPDELFMSQLFEGIDSDTSEVILGLNPTMEGEATSIYIKEQLSSSSQFSGKITRLAQGLPLGGDVEYADAVTLGRALEGRREY